MFGASLQVACLLLLLILSAGSLLNLSTSAHWFVRGWDFPRMQILTIAALAAGIFLLVQLASSQSLGETWVWLNGGLFGFLLAWHGCRILPYTPLWKKQTLSARAFDSGQSLRMVISNVQQENAQHEKWIATMERVTPDIVLAVEINDRWLADLKSWMSQYPHRIVRPQDNWYGMLLASRLPLLDAKFRFLVQDDVPTVDARVRLASGKEVRVIGVHPRPPEPKRDNDSSARDAELMVLAQELRSQTEPVVLGGDLNDVAWSRTTRLFLRISNLLDPRRGRGFFNSFHAQHWYMRFPLDHVFHSPHFTLRDLRRLNGVGSDHFPILIDLQYEPGMQSEQDALRATEADLQQGQELIDKEKPFETHSR